jgi:hypothetical protein
MNALLQHVTTAGARVHEEQYGARLQLLNVEIPCSVSGLLKNFTLVEGGRSVRNMVESLVFRKDALLAAQADGNQPITTVPAKGVFVSLLPASETEFIPLKLDAGGLDASGLIYQFVAFDRDYAA